MAMNMPPMPIDAPTTKMRAASKLPGPKVVEAAPERASKLVVANAAVVGAGTMYEMRPPPCQTRIAWGPGLVSMRAA